MALITFLVWVLFAALSVKMADQRNRSMIIWGIAGFIIGFIAPIILLVIGSAESEIEVAKRKIRDNEYKALYTELGDKARANLVCAAVYGMILDGKKVDNSDISEATSILLGMKNG